MTNYNTVLNLENYIIDPNATDLTVTIHRIGNNISYEAALCAINHLPTDSLILYMHFMQCAQGKDCVLDFGELLRSAPMCGDLLQSAIANLMVEGYLTYTLPEHKFGYITTFEIREYPFEDALTA